MNNSLTLLFIIIASRLKTKILKCSDFISFYNNLECKQEEYVSRGSYGLVFWVKDIADKKSYALKAIPNFDGISKIKEQEQILDNFNSKFVMKVIESRDTGDYFTILTNFALNGDLKRFIIQNEPLLFYNRHICLAFIYKIALGIKEIHSKNYVHGDLKLQNILVGDDLDPFLIDFDLSVKDGTDFNFKGTAYYSDPDLYFNDEYTPSIFRKSFDIYSFGVIIYRITQRLFFPFSSISEESFMEGLKAGKYVISDLDPLISYLIYRCILVDPLKRPSIEWILDYIQSIFLEKRNKLQLETLDNKGILPKVILDELPDNYKKAEIKSKEVKVENLKDHNEYLSTINEFIDNIKVYQRLKLKSGIEVLILQEIKETKVLIPQEIKAKKKVSIVYPQKSKISSFFSCFGGCFGNKNKII